MNRTSLDPRHEPIVDALPRLKKQLEGECSGVSPEQIDKVAKHSIDRLEGARVREFVPILAWKHARSHLQRSA